MAFSVPAPTTQFMTETKDESIHAVQQSHGRTCSIEKAEYPMTNKQVTSVADHYVGSRDACARVARRRRAFYTNKEMYYHYNYS